MIKIERALAALALASTVATACRPPPPENPDQAAVIATENALIANPPDYPAEIVEAFDVLEKATVLVEAGLNGVSWFPCTGTVTEMVEKEGKVLIIVLTADHCFGKLNEADEIFNDQSTLSVRLLQPHRYSAGINPYIIAGGDTDQSRLVYVGSESSDLGIFAMEVDKETLTILPLSFVPPALSLEPNSDSDEFVYRVFPYGIRREGIKRTTYLLSDSGGNLMRVTGEDVGLDIPGEFVVMGTLPGPGSSGGGVIKVDPDSLIPKRVIGIISAEGLGGGSIKGGGYIDSDFSLITLLDGYIDLVSSAKELLGW